jgi:transposase InsO family protein
MREDNLLSVQPRAWVTTTNSGHELEVRMNLAMRMKVNGINQLWVADITYIRLAGEFVYLAVVLDVYSRKVVGWALGRTLAASLAVAALKQAIEQRKPPPGLVHHSDRGLQYVSQEYVQVLDQYQITPSMSRPGNPYDNAFCESFMRTFKREEIDARTYPRPGRSARPCRGVHRAVLQSLPAALGARLPAAGRVRAGGCTHRA